MLICGFRNANNCMLPFITFGYKSCDDLLPKDGDTCDRGSAADV